MTYTKSIFIFRRDLRIQDNTGLNAAMELSEKVIPIFIFDPRQVGDSNSFRSSNAIQFMTNSLKEVNVELKKKDGKLYIFYGKADEVLEKIIKSTKAQAVFVNEDYTPFSMKRDKKLAAICKKFNTELRSFHDYTLQHPDSIKTKSDTPYGVFTPFFKASALKDIRKPNTKRSFNLYKGSIAGSQPEALYKKVCPVINDHILVQGGRNEGLQLLRNTKKLSDYKNTRDIPSLSTSHLSAHIKFGTISIRETFETIKKNKNAPLLRQLYWRDFFTQVAFHNPHVFGQEYQEKYRNLWWSSDRKAFNRWCKGETGFPIVDAGMRQLNTIGYMHNRTRMIVASFLTKDLHINWQWGEKYFAQQLVDYDPCVNNGSWQWAASTGCDAQPYFRIFNPWLQQKKFDPECVYIKKWVPELAHVPAKDIHNWEKKHTEYDGYFAPMVDHKVESRKAKEIFKKAR